MEDVKPEEKSPLLLYLVEGDGNVAKNNQRVNFDKGRLYGISSGATTVFTEFPNYISPCWITALLSSLIFFIMVLLMVSSMNPSSSIRVPRCTHGGLEKLGNRTIHLVHWTSEGWTVKQLDALQRIKREYSGYNVHLVLLHDGISTTKSAITTAPLYTTQIHNSTKFTSAPMKEALIEIKKEKRNKRNIKNSTKRKKVNQFSPIGIGFGVKSLLDILLGNKVDANPLLKRNVTNELPDLLNLTELLPITTESHIRTFEAVAHDFPGLTIENISKMASFHKTPLQNTWTKLSPDLILFAVRILHLWQYGGLSFKIDVQDNFKAQSTRNQSGDIEKFTLTPDSDIQTDTILANLYTDSVQDKLSNFIQKGKESFERLPKEVVTADDEGLHIFTKSPCHAFFGEVLINLRRARGDETIKYIIQRSLKIFCKHSAVGSNYCRNLIRAAG